MAQFEEEQTYDFEVTIASLEDDSKFTIEASKCKPSKLLWEMIEEQEESFEIPIQFMNSSNMNFIKDFLELFHTTPFGEVPKPLINHTIDDSIPPEWTKFIRDNFHLEIDIEKQTCNLPIQIIENNYLNIANYLDCKKLIEVLCCFISSRDYLYGRSETEVGIILQQFHKEDEDPFPKVDQDKELDLLKSQMEKTEIRDERAAAEED